MELVHGPLSELSARSYQPPKHRSLVEGKSEMEEEENVFSPDNGSSVKDACPGADEIVGLRPLTYIRHGCKNNILHRYLSGDSDDRCDKLGWKNFAVRSGNLGCIESRRTPETCMRWNFEIMPELQAFKE